MYALSGFSCPVHFGGECSEHWSEDYRLKVSYTGGETYTGRFIGSGWVSDAPLPDLPLAKEYFDAVCAVAYYGELCTRLGFQRKEFYEVFSSKSSIAPYELLRVLLDDWGWELEEAVGMVVRCCPVIDPDIDLEKLCKLNPRITKLATVLKNALSDGIFPLHDSRRQNYRLPVGAAKTGDRVRLAVKDAGSGTVGAVCLLQGDNLSCEYPMSKTGSGFEVNITLPDTPAALWYSFHLYTKQGERWLCPDGGGFWGVLYESPAPGFRLTVYDRDFVTPDWFKSGIMYQIFPDRFGFGHADIAKRGIEYHRALGQSPELHGSMDEPVRWQARDFEKDYEPDDFYGGTLRGIEDRLPYLKALGITVLYLNPIVEARSNHRYDTSDYTKVDPILGDNADFSRLCAAADNYGIRIILDGVFSHTGDDSVYFDAFGHYGGNPHREWYCQEDGQYKCWWGFKSLPEVNEENPGWQDFVVTGDNSIVKVWLRRGAAGWRIDVADELPDDVLALIRQAAKEEKPEAVILGEVWEDAITKISYGHRRDYALGRSLDSVMNYPLRAAVLDFIHGLTDACGLRDFLDGQRLNYPPPLYKSLMNLMGSHDVERLRTALSVSYDVKNLPRLEQAKFSVSDEADERAAELQKLCAAIQFSLPGVPSIYYGDELGMTGCRDPFNRLPFKEYNHSLFDFYASLGKIRREQGAMSRGKAEFYALGPDVLLIRRCLNGQNILTFINRSERDRVVITGCRSIDLISGERLSPEFTLPPLSVKILKTL